MTTADPMTNGVAGVDPEPRIALDLGLSEAEALRAWLLKASADGTTALDEPLVNSALNSLALAVDAAQAIVNVRRELVQAGLDVSRLSDDQVRELGRRVSEAALPGIRS